MKLLYYLTGDTRKIFVCVYCLNNFHYFLIFTPGFWWFSVHWEPKGTHMKDNEFEANSNFSISVCVGKNPGAISSDQVS